MADLVYNRGIYNVVANVHDLANDVLKVMLLADTYTPDKDHNVLADVSTHEISGTGYTAGGATLANVTVTEDDTNDRVTLDGDDVVWANATFTARYAVIYDDTPAGDPLWKLVDFGANVSASGADFTVAWAAEGIHHWQQAA